MSDEFAQYKASNFNKSSKKDNSNDEFAQYKASNFKSRKELDDKNIDFNQIKNAHPYIAKLAELVHGTPGLQQAGDIAGKFNRAVEQTALPSAARGVFGTGIEMGRGLTNLIPGVNIPQHQYPELFVEPHAGQAAEILGSFGLGKPVYGAYQTAKAGVEALPYLKNIPPLLKNLLAGGATGAALSPEHRKLGATIGTAAEILPSIVEKIANYAKGFSPKHKSNQYIESLLSHEREQAALQEAKDEANSLYKMQKPESLMKSAAEKERDLLESQKFKENRLPNEQQLPGQQTVPEFEHLNKTINQEIAQHLGEGESHSEHLAENIVNAIEGNPITIPHPKTGLPKETRIGGLREEIGKKYDVLEENLPNVSIPQSPDTKAIDKELEKLVGSKSNLADEEKAKLRTLIEQTHPSATNKIINGKTFFRAYRSLRKLEGEERSNAFGLSPKEHDEWIDRANSTKKTYEDMENIINKHFPKDTIKQLHQINHEYATKVAPLHENPLYQSFLKHGKYEGNIINALSGTTKGNKILNNLIKADPALSRLVIGSEFAHQPEKLLLPNERLEEFVKVNPNIAKLMQQQRTLQTGLEEAKTKAELYKNVKNEQQLLKDIKKQRSLAHDIKTQLDRTNLSSIDRRHKEAELKEAQRKSTKLFSRALGGALATTGIVGAISKLLQ